MLECDKVMAHAFSHWTGERFGLVTCHNANISLCGATEDTDEFEVIVYNPRMWHDSGWAGVKWWLLYADARMPINYHPFTYFVQNFLVTTDHFGTILVHMTIRNNGKIQCLKCPYPFPQ
jgi:hypothetical protein